MSSEAQQRRFPPPWRVDRSDKESFQVLDANGITLATIHCRDDLQRWSFGHQHLTSDEARRIALAIARLPEFLMQRRGFYPRGTGSYRWSSERPYHVAIEDSYMRAHWSEITAICRLNSIPFKATGEQIQDGSVWRVYEFASQLDAILFWNRFQGRWLRGSEFHFPEQPSSLPELKSSASRGFNPPRPER